MSLIYSQVTNLYIVQVQTKKFHKLQKKKKNRRSYYFHIQNGWRED